MKPVWVNDLPNAVKTALCRSDVLRTLGLTTNGSGNHRTVQRWIDDLGLDVSHFNINKSRGKRVHGRKKEAKDIFTKNTTLTGSAKKKLKHIYTN
jgi:hypothetical protein